MGNSSGWNMQKQSSAEMLLFFLENTVKSLTSSQSDEFNVLKFNEYFIFAMNELCLKNLNSSELVFNQVCAMAIFRKLQKKYIVTKRAPFQYGILYSKIFSIVYEFHNTNLSYKYRI